MSFICILFIITLFLLFLTYDFFPVTQRSNTNKLLCFYISWFVKNFISYPPILLLLFEWFSGFRRIVNEIFAFLGLYAA